MFELDYWKSRFVLLGIALDQGLCNESTHAVVIESFVSTVGNCLRDSVAFILL